MDRRQFLAALGAGAAALRGGALAFGGAPQAPVLAKNWAWLRGDSVGRGFSPDTWQRSG
jgi:hypothetical protein